VREGDGWEKRDLEECFIDAVSGAHPIKKRASGAVEGRSPH
jgi:hypothetical protein